MGTTQLLKELRELGVRFRVVEGELKISAPQGVITPELREQIVAAKSELIELVALADQPAIAAEVTIPPADRNRPVPLSFAQQRMWFLEEFEGGTSIYNIPWAMRIRGELDTEALRKAVNRLVARHEIMRTCFVAEDGEPRQEIRPALELEIESLEMTAASDQEILETLEAWSREPFDLSAGPLFRVRVITRDENDHVLMMIMHHIISDAWSLNVLQTELFGAYASFSAGSEPAASELPLQFADYAAWQRGHLQGEELERQLAYWTNELEGAPPLLELPTDHPRPGQQSFRGKRARVELPLELREQLKQLAHETNATLFMVLLAAFYILLARYSRQDDIVIGTPIAGRQDTRLESLIGLFVNTLVLRADLGANPTFRELLAQVQATALDAFGHQELPFDRLVEALSPARDMSYTPLFQVQFMLQNAPGKGEPLAGLELEPVDFDYGTAKFDLSLATGETLDGLVAEFEYSTDLFDTPTIERMLVHYQRLLEGIVAAPATRIGDLPMLSAAEEQQLLVEWNDTEVAYPADATMHGLFEAHAAEQPDAPALWAEGETLSYAELNRRANRLASHLRELGVAPGVLVGICIERNIHMIPGLLAILKAGGAYVPLDPNYPADRVRFMLEDSQAPVLLTQTALVETLPEHNAQLVCLDSFDWGDEDVANPGVHVDAAELGYVIYTSGSTGKPKGVAIEHRNAAALIQWAGDVFERSEFDGVLAATSVCFDLSVYEIFVTLGQGGRIILVKDALSLASLPADTNVTLINTVPSAIAELVRMQAIPDSVRTVNLAGEPLATSLVDQIYAAASVRDVNDLYGPSEDTTYSTWTRRDAGAPATIGRPIHNTQAYLLDQFGSPVPVGIPGELFLGGAGVTRGYLHRPELTAEKYVPDRFSGKPGARLYRTGDKARYRTDGNIEFMGRLDNQIKLRGFRIELGEIEARLAKHPAVREAVAIVREDAPGDQRLVAYVVAEDGSVADLIADGAMNDWLAEVLPGFMIPGALVELDEFPLTPNGKVDRKALPAPEWQSQEDYVAPATPMEKQLAEIWTEVLGSEKIGVRDNFFTIGGHSLLAMKVVSRVRERLEADLPLADFFARPTIAGLAEVLGGSAGAAQSIPAADRGQPLPMSFSQQRLWFLFAVDPQASTYNMPLPVEIAGELDADIMRTAVNKLVARHESLRTVFADEADGPVQIVLDTAEVPVRSESLAGASDEKIRERVNTLAREPFDLRSGPLLRIDLLSVSPERSVLLINIHHIISDAWSQDVMLGELARLYEAAANNTEATLPDLPIQFADYAVWQQHSFAGEAYEKQLAYWKQQLTGAPPLLNLPLDKPRPLIETHVGAMHTAVVDAALSEQLEAIARARGCTLYALLLTAFNALLYRFSGEDDIVIGTPVTGRRRPELEGLIGFCLNTLAVRTTIDGNPRFGDLLRNTRQAVTTALANQDVPFEKLVEELQPARNMSHAPVFQVLFDFQHAGTQSGDFAGKPLQYFGFDYCESKVDLQLTLAELPDGIGCSWLYNIDLFEADTIARLHGYFEALLRAIVKQPDGRVDQYALLGPEEERRLLVEWNSTARKYPADASIQSLFEAQVSATPDAVALVCDGKSMAYAELNSQANRLAHYLIKQGVGERAPIGVAMDRGPHAIIAILAALKTGGAYVPLDPAYPAERLRYMVADAGLSFVVSTSNIDLPADEEQKPLVRIDLDALDLSAEADSNPEIEGQGTDLAYMVYTSGSTGLPKGTQIEHRNVLRLVCNTDFGEFTRGTRISMLAPISFDASTFEMWGPLLNGGCCIIFSARNPDIESLRSYFTADEFDYVFLTTQLFNTIIDLAPEILQSVRHLYTGGEAMSIPHIGKAASLLPDTALYNIYGPTESTTFSTYFPITEAVSESWRCIPIGKPIANTRTYILDDYMRPVPIGIAGELYVGGDGLSRGYLNKPELTAERFLADPFSPQPDARMYRTGDVVRYRADGNIEFIGRNDNQIKLRGFRIELGEIEAALSKHPNLKSAAVLLHDWSEDDRRLVAYVVTDRRDGELAAELKQFMRERVPNYMLPSVYVPVDFLPHTANGKLDRAALPDPHDYVHDASGGSVAEDSPAQLALADIWKDLLDLEEVGPDESFFDLGGHSLLTIKLIQIIEKATGRQLAIADVFEGPTIRELAELLADAEWELPAQPARTGLIGRLRGLFAR